MIQSTSGEFALVSLSNGNVSSYTSEAVCYSLPATEFVYLIWLRKPVCC